MPSELRIALVQTDLIWKDKEANLRNFEELISPLENIDLIILPELFNTAFCIDDMSIAENEYGDTLLWMQQIAQQKNSAICGSILFVEDQFYYNRFLFVKPDGKFSHYNKRHLFSLVGEDKLLTKGSEKIVVNYKDWNIQPFICYDLRFPAWCQNDDDADLQLYVANWPAKRIHHWKNLLQAQSIENQCYVAGVNRIGKDNYDNNHTGYSAVFDFTGKLMAVIDNVAGTEIVKLSKSDLKIHREHYTFWKDRDTFRES